MILYSAGRIFGVATRPIFLFLANNYLLANVAEGIAVAILASALALVAASADPHRGFYLRYFGPNPRTSGITFHVYLSSLWLLCILGSSLVWIVGIKFTGSPSLSMIAVIFFLSEKLADELLRLKLFQRNFDAWGRASIFRSFLQLGGLACAFLVMGAAVPAWLAILILAVSNGIVFLPQLPAGLMKNVWRRGARTALWLMRRATRSLLGNWQLWALALLTASIGYLDRLLALAMDKSALPLFMLVVMCFSIVQLAVDFFYLSRHRRDILEQRISLSDALTSRDFLLSCAGGLIVAITACAVVLRFSNNGSEFPLAYVIGIAVLQLTVAITIVPQQIHYWRNHWHRLVTIDIAFWILFSLLLCPDCGLNGRHRFFSHGVLRVPHYG